MDVKDMSGLPPRLREVLQKIAEDVTNLGDLATANKVAYQAPIPLDPAPDAETMATAHNALITALIAAGIMEDAPED